MNQQRKLSPAKFDGGRSASDYFSNVYRHENLQMAVSRFCLDEKQPACLKKIIYKD
jgi:hypothetical protein